jgi:FkbM family methyltransferase
MVDVVWGQRETHLCFDRYPYPPGSEDHRGAVTYENEIVNVAEHFIEEGDVAIDVGACIGFHTCLLAKLVGEQGIVYAFEPQQISFDLLTYHAFKANQLANVACLRAIIWNESVPKMELWSPPDIGYSSIHRYLNSYQSETVMAVALDEIIPEDQHPRFVKVDVEGSELQVLQGAHKMLVKGVDCVVLEFNYHLLDMCQKTDFEIREYMAALGYDMFIINIAHREKKNVFIDPIMVAPDVPITLKGGHHINVMFSTLEKVSKRWKT